MNKATSNVVHRTNPKTGAAEVGVHLSNSKDLAWTSRDAFDHIVAQYGQVPWFLNDDGKGRVYVRLARRETGQPAMVSRLVAGENPRKVIKYHDGDRLNLRPENLMVCHGHGGVKRKAQAAPLSPA